MNYTTNFQDEWMKLAVSRGYVVEDSGDGKLIAHQDGDERGCWDFNYGGAGFGWFY